MYNLFSIFFLIFFLSTSCSKKQEEPADSEIIESELSGTTRELLFVDTTVDKALKACQTVLKDNDFIMHIVEPEAGFLSAYKEESVDNQSDRYWYRYTIGKHARWAKKRICSLTAMLIQSKNSVKMRLYVQTKDLDNRGKIYAVNGMQDEIFFKNISEKMKKLISNKN